MKAERADGPRSWARLAWMLSCLAATTPVAAAQGEWLAGEMEDTGEHPRVAYLPSELPTIRERLDREPYLGLLAQLVWLAGQEWDPDDHDVDTERGKANTARAAAWLFAVDRTLDEWGDAVPFPDDQARDEVGEKAAGYLLSMYTVSRAKGFIEYTDDIHTAQELHLWAETLDLLLGADRDVLGDERARAVQQVADLAADLYADFCISNWIPTRTLVNNHRTKTASALGIAAIALNGEPIEPGVDDGRYDPALWIDFGLRNVDFTIRDILTDADGGDQEGGAYLAYSGIDHYPFLRAWHAYTGAASYEMSWDEPVPPYYVVGAEEPYTLPDMWSDPALDRQLTWIVRTRMPDGTIPPTDDCSPGSRLFLGAFVQPWREHAGLYRWAWEDAGFAAGGSVDTAPLLIASYDDSVPAVDPESAGLATHQWLPAAGQALFRSGWGDGATYVLLQAEHGKAAAISRTRWGEAIDGAAGHEHADATSFLLAAGEETLVLDPGYLGWDDHERIWAASDHNLILVDGLGPALPYLSVPPLGVGPDGELVLTDTSVEGGWTAAGDGLAYLTVGEVDTPGVAFAQVSASYGIDAPPTRLRRHVTFLDDRFLVLHDRVAVRDDRPHVLTHTLHMNCGGTSGGVFEPLEDGALCTRDGARLRLAVLSPAGGDQTTREDEHDVGYGAERTHTVLETHAHVHPGAVGAFLGLLLVESADGEGFEEVTVRRTGDGALAWEHGEQSCAAWIGEVPPGTLPQGSRLPSADSGALCVDGEAEVGVLEGLGDDPAALVTVRLEGGAAPLAWRAVLHAQGPDRDRILLTMPAPPAGEPDGACGWEETGDGQWRIEAPAPGLVTTTGAARDTVAAVRLSGVGAGSPAVIPRGQPAVSDASLSCSRSGGELHYRWTLLDAPEMSWADLPPAEQHGPILSFTPDLPGSYRLQVQVTSAEGLDTAELVFEVEGEPPAGEDSVYDEGEEDWAIDRPLNRNPGGCTCGVGSRVTLPWTAPALGWVAALAWRRRARTRTGHAAPDG